jgi:hypothetical protein
LEEGQIRVFYYATFTSQVFLMGAIEVSLK